MISEEFRALIAYRLEQAEEALADASLLLQNGSCRAVINRSYYAMFYSILALLLLSGKGTSKHSGAIAMFDRDFVKEGGFDKKFSKWLHQAFEERLKSDYNVMVLIAPEDAELTLEHARSFVEQVKQFLEEKWGRT